MRRVFLICTWSAIVISSLMQIKTKNSISPAPHSFIPVFLPTLMASAVKTMSDLGHIHPKQIRAKGGGLQMSS